jgi:hypothetical protein
VDRDHSSRRAGPQVPDVLPAAGRQPRSGGGVALCDIRLRDADGVEIPLLGARVEQIAVNEAHGALPCRLHRHGDVIGRAAHFVYVRFDGEYHHSELRPNLLRLLPASGYYGLTRTTR